MQHNSGLLELSYVLNLYVIMCYLKSRSSRKKNFKVSLNELKDMYVLVQDAQKILGRFLSLEPCFATLNSSFTSEIFIGVRC